MSSDPVKRLLFICFIVLLVFSCDKDSDNPVGPITSDEFGSIVVTIVDKYDKPFADVMVFLESANAEYHQVDSR